MHKENALLINDGRVEMAITKGQPVFVVLMLESARNSDATTLHPSAQSLIEEFEDIFPQDLPPGLSLKRVIDHQIDFLPGALLPNKPAHRCNPTETKDLQRQV